MKYKIEICYRGGLDTYYCDINFRLTDEDVDNIAKDLLIGQNYGYTATFKVVAYIPKKAKLLEYHQVLVSRWREK